MYLHLGQDTVIREDSIIGIFDLEITSQSRRTRDFLAGSEAAGRVETVGDDLPRSFLLWGKGEDWRVYLSQLSPATLARRSAERAWARGAEPPDQQGAGPASVFKFTEEKRK